MEQSTPGAPTAPFDDAWRARLVRVHDLDAAGASEGYRDTTAGEFRDANAHDGDVVAALVAVLAGAQKAALGGSGAAGAFRLELAPPADDRLTAADLTTACCEIAALMGGGDVTVLATAAGHGSERLSMLATPTGGTRQYFAAKTFADLFAKAREWAVSARTDAERATVRRLALDIMDLTGEHGTCTVAMLLGRDWPHDTVARLHLAACRRASEIAGNAPFAVDGLGTVREVA